MMVQKNRSEKGQALILIVFGIVGLLGFAALAIDGGRIYTDRRNMQNSSDTASLTAAASIANYMSANGVYYSNWTCDDTQPWYISAKAQAFSDAIDRAAINGGYIIDTDATDDNGVMAECGVDGFEKFIDVTTYITHDTPSSFAQFVFGGPLRQTVISTARVYPQTSGGFGHAIVALNEADCTGNQSGVTINGTIDIEVNGGGVFSNGCLRASGAHLEVNVDDGGNTYIAEYDTNGGPTVNPAPVQATEPMSGDTFAIDPPNCNHSSMQARTYSNGQTVMEPGRYASNISITSSGSNVTMNPGLYCFYGVFKMTGGVLNASSGVTIYMDDDDLEIGGNVLVTMHAPLGTATAVAPAIPNLVVYLPPGHTGNVSMLGTTGSSYAGTVYAPDAYVKVGGNAGINPTYSTQIIGWDVSISGTSDVYINFSEEFAYQFPPRLDLNR
ncbi:MAG TPA: Tad domain-containing protein [Anaerolineales bacterium]|nr:Tad domain-containing protein [Anaerolineales bacterium]